MATKAKKEYTYDEYIQEFCGGIDSSVWYVLVNEMNYPQDIFTDKAEAERCAEARNLKVVPVVSVVLMLLKGNFK